MLGNPKQTKDEIVQWIRNYFNLNGPKCHAVVGISGGKDSSIVAALCVEALGKERVVGVLMPNGKQSDIVDSYRIVEALGIDSVEVNIGECASSLVGELENTLLVSQQALINLAPRIRMATLYAVAQSLPNGGRVANTCNRSEDFVGYSTKFGDSAGDFGPIANLLVHEVVQIGLELPIPRDLVEKVPSDGLCGKTDEDNLGVTYKQIDDYITYGACSLPAAEQKIKEMHRKNLHKLLPMPAFVR